MVFLHIIMIWGGGKSPPLLFFEIEDVKILLLIIRQIHDELIPCSDRTRPQKPGVSLNFFFFRQITTTEGYGPLMLLTTLSNYTSLSLFKSLIIVRESLYMGLYLTVLIHLAASSSFELTYNIKTQHLKKPIEREKSNIIL